MIQYGGGSGGGGGGGGEGSFNCQECGNQAKKDCRHMRCRSCCKSQGFHCETHVKSTWVPAARRRQKQQQLTLGGREETTYTKRSRDNNHTINNNNPASSSLASTHLVSSSPGLDMSCNFPAELNSEAVFRCVRVSTRVDEEEEQYAYKTAVNIGGRVFKGILYDQGHDDSNPFSAIGGGSLEGSSGGAQLPLHLISTAATTTAATPSAYPYQYPTPQNAFMDRTQFFPLPRP